MNAHVPTLALDRDLLAFDRGTDREIDKDGRLHVAVSNISKAAVNDYLGSEIPEYQKLGLEPDKVYKLLRDPEELKKAVPTLNGVQVLRKHIPISAEDHQPWDVVGTTGTTAEFVDPYLQDAIIIWVKGDIDDIVSGKKKQISMGYHYKPDMTPGVFEGEEFQGVMRNIIVNHVALVESGRAGPDVMVNDSADELQWSLIEKALQSYHLCGK